MILISAFIANSIFAHIIRFRFLSSVSSFISCDNEQQDVPRLHQSTCLETDHYHVFDGTNQE